MRGLRVWCLSVACLAASPCLAEKTVKMVGNFVLVVDQDPFSGDARAVAQVKIGDDIVVLRCLENSLSVAIIRDHPMWGSNEDFKVSFRADDGGTTELEGVALAADTIGLYDSSRLFDAMIGASSVAFRVKWLASSYSFRIHISQVDKVIAEVKEVCGN